MLFRSVSQSRYNFLTDQAVYPSCPITYQVLPSSLGFSGVSQRPTPVVFWLDTYTINIVNWANEPDAADPIATDRKKSATIWLWNALGANRVARELPTGERKSSPIVATKRRSATDPMGALSMRAKGTNTRKDSPQKKTPHANLVELCG